MTILAAAPGINDYLLDPTKAAAYDKLGIVGALFVVLLLVMGGGLALIGAYTGILARVFTKGIAFLKEQTTAMGVLSARHEALHDANTAVLDRLSNVMQCPSGSCPVRKRLIPVSDPATDEPED